MITIHHRLTPRQLWLIAAGLLVLLVFGRIITQTAQASSSESRSGRHVLTIYDGGHEHGVLTEADTLRDALGEAGIKLAANDVTEPGLDEELVAATYEVNIYRARPVTVVDGNAQTKVMTPYQTAKQIAKQAGVALRDEDHVNMQHTGDVLVTGSLERLVIDRAAKVNFVFFGKKLAVYTHAATVGEMLGERDIALEKNDTLSTKESTPIKSGMSVEIWRNGKQTVTEDEVIKKTVQEIRDADRKAGYREVKTPGKDGKRSVTYEVIMKNGKEVSRKEVSSIVTAKPVKEVVIVGVKGLYTGGPLSEKQIIALGTCESGMTPDRNSGNGFYGAFQFMPATWRSVAPAPYNNVMPHEAPLDAQKQAVQNLLSRSSIHTQFPGCASKMSAQGII